MNRHLLTISLHWCSLILLMLVLATGVDNPIFVWPFGLAALALVATALLKGLMNDPGPRLTGALRRAHPWIGRTLYALLAWGGLAVIAHQLGRPLPGPGARTVLLILLGVGLLHGIFNLWRSTALYDGVLRRMLP